MIAPASDLTVPAAPRESLPSTAAGPAPQRPTVDDFAALFVLLAIAGVSAFIVDFHVFSDDQKTYIRIANDILSRPVVWMPSDSFAYVLAALYRLCGDWAQTFTLIYGMFAGLYLVTAYACLRWLRLGSAAALCAALVSLVPHYTLGMTSWGFAGAEFVTARITILPIAAVLMTLFLRHHGSRRVAWIFPAAAAGSFLHLSSAFLFVILLIAYGLVRLRDLRRAFAEAFAPLLLSALMIAPLAYRVLFPPGSAGFDVILMQIYDQMAAVQGPAIDALSPAAATDLLWRAAYAGFWWSMFPPRAGDLAYVLAENALILTAAGLAWTRRFHAGGREARLAGGLAAVAVGAAVTAYGFQTANFLAWKLAGAAPKLFEEVRAFGFLYWPIYVSIGCVFQGLGKGFAKALLLAALLVSPTMAVRALPDPARLSLRSAALHYGPSDLNQEYLEKALGLHAHSREELDRLLASLGPAQPGQACRIIGLEHELKRSGCAVFVSYQDKRSPLRNPGRQVLLVWYLSYQEIRSAIESGDPDRIAEVAARYRANLAVLPRPVHDPRFVPVFSGVRWHAYRVASENGTIENVRP